MTAPDLPNAAAFAARLSETTRRVGQDMADPRLGQARQAAEHLRGIIDRITATTAPAEALASVTARLAEIEAELGGFDQVRRTGEGSEGDGFGHPPSFFEWSPLLGYSSALAPPMSVHVDGDTVVGMVRFGVAYEGPPGCVHGGYVAAAFDELLGVTQSLSGQVGMTGTLTVKYRRPTPLHTDLRFVGRVTGRSGRKVVTVGQVFDQGVLTAEAEALFVSVTTDKFTALAPRREPEPG